MLEPKKNGNRIVKETLASIYCKANFWGKIFVFVCLFSGTCILHSWSGPRTLVCGRRILAKDTCPVSWVAAGTTVARERPDHQCLLPVLYPLCPPPPHQESSRMKEPSEIPDSPLAGFHPPGLLGMPFRGET